MLGQGKFADDGFSRHRHTLPDLHTFTNHRGETHPPRSLEILKTLVEILVQ